MASSAVVGSSGGSSSGGMTMQTPIIARWRRPPEAHEDRLSRRLFADGILTSSRSSRAPRLRVHAGKAFMRDHDLRESRTDRENRVERRQRVLERPWTLSIRAPIASTDHPSPGHVDAIEYHRARYDRRSRQSRISERIVTVLPLRTCPAGKVSRREEIEAHVIDSSHDAFVANRTDREVPHVDKRLTGSIRSGSRPFM